jgi:large subunit ribosomal protein L4
MKELQTPLYTQQGKQDGTLTLPSTLFGLPKNDDLVHQVIVSMQANARLSLAHTKDRSEVRGGGKKPWQQKGTGRARHGSSRSPIWVGGGITHGPRTDRDYTKKINHKMRLKALTHVLSQKFEAGRMLFVNDMKLAEPKTKQAMEIFSALATVPGFETLNTKKSNNVLVILPEANEHITQAVANLPHVTLVTAIEVNPLHIAGYRYVIVAGAESVIEILDRRSHAHRKETIVSA